MGLNKYKLKLHKKNKKKSMDKYQLIHTHFKS